MGCGISTNTMAELVALWALFVVAKDLGIPSLNVFGDSTVIINWAKNAAPLASPCLDHWFHDIRILMNSFSFLVIKHTYREHNQQTCCLLKEALDLAPGYGNFSEYIDGLNELKGVFQLF